MVVHGVEELRIEELQAGPEQLEPDEHRHAAAMKNIVQAKIRYMVPMSLWLVA